MTYTRAPYWDENATWMGKTLPSVEECLPEVPKIANELPNDFFADGKMEIGKYGGTMMMLNGSIDWNPDIFLMLNEPFVSSPGTTGMEVLPNVCESYEVSDDKKEFTFKLRKGLKWSDGTPVSMDDVKFAIEDFMFNEELQTAGPPAKYHDNGDATAPAMKFAVIDDYSFKLSFGETYGKFVLKMALADWAGYTDIIKPAHILKKYHIKYGTVEDIEAKATADKVEYTKPEDWINVFNWVDITNWDLTHREAIDFPQLHPFVVTKVTGEQVDYTRNPYYFKVDESGQQLPYIDKIVSRYVGDIEVMNMQILAGEADMMRESATLSKMALYRENEATGGYISPLLGTHVDNTHVQVNWTYDYGDKATIGKLFRDVEFRGALNLAWNKADIIDTLYFGYADPAFLIDPTFDLDKANSILDGMGLTKNANGMRVMENGKTIDFLFESDAAAPEWPQVCEIMAQNWKDAGINASSKQVSGDLKGQRNDANELQGTATWIHVPMFRAGMTGDLTRPNADARLWYMYMNSNGENGEEPPDFFKRIWDIEADMLKALPGSPEDDALVNEVYKLYYDNNFRYQLGTNFQQPIILNAKFGNVEVKGMCVAMDIAGEILYFKD